MARECTRKEAPEVHRVWCASPVHVPLASGVERTCLTTVALSATTPTDALSLTPGRHLSQDPVPVCTRVPVPICRPLLQLRVDVQLVRSQARAARSRRTQRTASVAAEIAHQTLLECPLVVSSLSPLFSQDHEGRVHRFVLFDRVPDDEEAPDLGDVRQEGRQLQRLVPHHPMRRLRAHHQRRILDERGGQAPLHLLLLLHRGASRSVQTGSGGSACSGGPELAHSELTPTPIDGYDHSRLFYPVPFRSCGRSRSTWRPWRSCRSW